MNSNIAYVVTQKVVDCFQLMKFHVGMDRSASSWSGNALKLWLRVNVGTAGVDVRFSPEFDVQLIPQSCTIPIANLGSRPEVEKAIVTALRSMSGWQMRPALGFNALQQELQKVNTPDALKTFALHCHLKLASFTGVSDSPQLLIHLFPNDIDSMTALMTPSAGHASAGAIPSSVGSDGKSWHDKPSLL